MQYHAEFGRFCEALEGAGAFLVAEAADGRVNVMTIGWAQAGYIWGQPVMTALVRHSRHTHSILKTAAGFTVCVPARGKMAKELAFCGAKSGRDYDKARACGLKLVPGAEKGLKYMEGCALVYQCRLLGASELDVRALPEEVRVRYYKDGDPHTLYFGRIIKADHSS